jgi:PAS domain-containing protein
MQHQELSRRSVHHAAQVRELFQRSAGRAQSDPLLSRTLDELALLLEALEATEEELAQARERQLDGYALLQTEHQAYQELFNDAPFAYLTTRLDGTIRRANAAAQQLLGGPAKLSGQALNHLIEAEHRREFAHLLQRLSSAHAAERFTTAHWTLEGTTVCTSAGRPHEIRWVALPADSGHAVRTVPAAEAPANAVCAYVRCFADALAILERTPAWTPAGLQLAHLLTVTWADVVILEQWVAGEHERIIGVRGPRERSECCVVRQRDGAAGAAVPPAAGAITIADDAMFCALVLPEVCDGSAARLPLRGYHAVAHGNDGRWSLLCLRSADYADYTIEQHAMLDVLVEQMMHIER